MSPIAEFKFVHGDYNYGDVKEINTSLGVYPFDMVEIMQYTGLRLGGKEIYESDIIGFADYMGRKNAAVIYDADSASWVIGPIKWWLGRAFKLNTGAKLIGNIYEHPELLEGGVTK